MERGQILSPPCLLFVESYFSSPCFYQFAMMLQDSLSFASVYVCCLQTFFLLLSVFSSHLCSLCPACTDTLAYVSPHRTRAHRYYKIFGEAQKGFKLASADAVHGSLLTLGELLKNSGGMRFCVCVQCLLVLALCFLMRGFGCHDLRIRTRRESIVYTDPLFVWLLVCLMHLRLF